MDARDRNICTSSFFLKGLILGANSEDCGFSFGTAFFLFTVEGLLATVVAASLILFVGTHINHLTYRGQVCLPLLEEFQTVIPQIG